MLILAILFLISSYRVNFHSKIRKIRNNIGAEKANKNRRKFRNIYGWKHFSSPWLLFIHATLSSSVLCV